jgi:hypothetical protein
MASSAPIRKLLLLLALLVLLAAGTFCGWVSRQPSPGPPADMAQRSELMFKIGHLGPGKAVPSDLQQQARALGADPDRAQAQMAAAGRRIEDRSSPELWLAALGGPLGEAQKESQRVELFRNWRFPVVTAAGAVALLLFVLAFQREAPAQ